MLLNIHAEEFEQEIKNHPDAIILDVRTEFEYQSGHLKNAVLLDFFSPTIQEDLGKLDKSKYYLIYCRSGARSYSACDYMNKSGFAKVANMMGGILSWHGEVVY